MGVEQGQIGKTEEMADLNKNQDPGVDSLSAARPYRPLSLRARLILLLFVIAIPLTGMALGFQKMIASYSASYDAILANLKTANEYNIKFKSDMEYSMYRVMIGLIDAEQFENGDIVEGETKYATAHRPDDSECTRRYTGYCPRYSKNMQMPPPGYPTHRRASDSVQ